MADNRKSGKENNRKPASGAGNKNRGGKNGAKNRSGNAPNRNNSANRSGNTPNKNNGAGRSGNAPNRSGGANRNGNAANRSSSAGRNRNAQNRNSNVNRSVNRSGSTSKAKTKKKDSGIKEKLIIIGSILAGLIIIAVLILNIPIIEITRTDKDGSTYTEYVSILEWIKSSQPLVEKEGNLSKDPNSYELNSMAENVDDKRDFTNDQIIEGQFNVLCLGFDESRELSDVMMLFNFDIANDELNILQIPRDSYVPDYTSSETAKINSVYMHGNQDVTPIQRVVDTVREMFDMPIDRYITTGCDDIVDMVDLIGGIPIDLPENVFYSYDKILYAGEQVLNGEQAELFVRARKGYIEGDIGRVKAQRLFLAAAMQKALDMGTIEVTKFLTEVYNKGYIGTDLTLKEMSILADFGGDLDMDKVTVHMIPGEAVDDYNGYSFWSIHKNATVDLLNNYFRPYQTDLSYDSLPITEIVEYADQSTNRYDDTQDTLQEIADGAKPGESKIKDGTENDESTYSDDN